jgi:Ser-Thr-rich glycosyl-phosphatidyl-inositol-anchored membrane family
VCDSAASNASLTYVAIASGLPNTGSYTWTVPANLAAGTDYALEITDGTEVNYFGPFAVVAAQAGITPMPTPSPSSTTSSPSILSSNPVSGSIASPISSKASDQSSLASETTSSSLSRQPVSISSQQTILLGQTTSSVQGVSLSSSMAVHNGHTGLSTGAKAGISVSVIAGSLVVFLILALVLLKRKRGQGNQPSDETQGYHKDAIATNAIAGDAKIDRDPIIAVSELDAYLSPKTELPAMPAVVLELSTSQTTTNSPHQELPDSRMAAVELPPSTHAQHQEMPGSTPAATQQGGHTIYNTGAVQPVDESYSQLLVSLAEDQTSVLPITTSPVKPIVEGDKIFISQTSPDEQIQCQPSSSIGNVDDKASQPINSSRIQDIEAAKAKIQERRARILALQQMDAEEDKLNQELAVLQVEASGNGNI